MKTIFATLASVIALYGLFLILSYAAMPGANHESQYMVPPYEPPPPEEPQYGGTLNVGHVGIGVPALSWDPADWNWKQNLDAGMYFEQLFTGDLEKSVRKGGSHAYTLQGYLPEDAVRGELAESWEWEDPLTVVIHLRHGIMFPDKPGVMKRRELTANDVVFSYNRQAQSPKKIPSFFDHIDRVFARDDHTVVFEFNKFNVEWKYRFGYGYYSGIIPREYEHVDIKDWRNAVGSGPFQLVDHVDGASQTYVRTPDYWDRELLNGKRYEIPFVERAVYYTIKDKATRLTALRTGQLDFLETIDWISVKHLRETTPELKWSRWMGTSGRFIALRCDQEPFDDVRVRRALNMAINHQEIVDHYFGGNAEIYAFPQTPDFTEYYEPLENMRPSVQELFAYDPEKAKVLLSEAGYPDGFTFTTQVSAIDTIGMDLIPLIVDYLAKVGVTVKVQPLEYAAYISAMTTHTNGPGYFGLSGHSTPTTAVRASFLTGQTWNMAKFSDPEIDARILEVHGIRDEETRQRKVKALTEDLLDLAPHIWMPIEYQYSAWWPWVKNYNGELRVGGQRPAPVYARIWIDQEMKKEMGFE